MLTKNHQDWLLSIPNYKTKYLDLGNPEALNWLTNHISMMITDNGLEWYREDLNYSGPYAAWVNRDSEQGKNRQGITENMYVQGHLAFWDTLKQRHPYLHIDACASGGRRNDLETMHRAVPLLRSDYQWAKFGDEYIAGNQKWIDVLDKETAGISPLERDKLCGVFRMCAIYENRLWDWLYEESV